MAEAMQIIYKMENLLHLLPKFLKSELQFSTDFCTKISDSIFATSTIILEKKKMPHDHARTPQT